MFKPNELERFSMLLDEPMKALELRIMMDIIRRLKINGEITRAADWQINRLYQLGVGMDEISADIQQALNFSDENMEKLYSDIIKAGYSRDEKLYEAVGKTFVPFDENEGLQQLISAVSYQTNETLHNITQSLGFAQRDMSGKLHFTDLANYYQQTLDNAMFDIASGAFDYNSVLKRTVKEMTNSGLRTVDYATGHKNRVDVAARRAVMTGLGQLTDKVNNDNAKALETDTFEISWHTGARPSHWWGGMWFTSEQLVSVCHYGEVDGLCGVNCYHDRYPVIPGISEPTYSKEELEELNRKEKETITFNGKEYNKYEATQRQRRLETTMRAQREEIKLLKEGGASEDDLINARARYRVTSNEYARFSEAAGLAQQRERVTVDGLGNIGQGKYTGGSGKASPVQTPPVGSKVTDKVTSEERRELLSREKVVLADNVKTTVDKSEKSAIIKAEEVKTVALENQRYGRNKETLVNKSYIDSGEYKRKFDNATDNPDVNKSLYDCAKSALKHRSGTIFEDMYWLDSETGRIVLSVTDSTDERAIVYSDRIKNSIKNKQGLITLHTHPSSMPPSASDLNSCYKNKYKSGFVACHNGRIFGYTSNELINERIYNMYIQNFIKEGYTEFDAQLKTLEKLSKSLDIRIWEVS